MLSLRIVTPNDQTSPSIQSPFRCMLLRRALVQFVATALPSCNCAPQIFTRVSRFGPNSALTRGYNPNTHYSSLSRPNPSHSRLRFWFPACQCPLVFPAAHSNAQQQPEILPACSLPRIGTFAAVEGIRLPCRREAAPRPIVVDDDSARCKAALMPPSGWEG
jgi:hypothetical protein